MDINTEREKHVNKCNFNNQVPLHIPLINSHSSYQTVASFTAVACSPSGQTQAAKRTAQTEATQNMNEELLNIMYKIELYS